MTVLEERDRGVRLPQRNKEFGELVTRLIGERSQRDVGRLTGVSYTYISDMAWGKVPSYEIVKRFADGLQRSEIGLSAADRAGLFRTAGYADWSFAAVVLPGGPEWDGGAFELEGMRRLGREYGPEYALVSDWRPPDPTMPEENIREILADREREIRRRKGLPEEGGIFT